MASGSVTKEIESRLKQLPAHIFEVFLEIHEPVNREPPAILIKYPNDFTDDILKTAANFAYPCSIPSDDQSEHFTFVVLDATGLTFRFGYCRRSNRESTCLCLISPYPWFDTFYTLLNDLSQIINSKSFADVETFLSSLYEYKLLPVDEFIRNEGKETMEIRSLSRTYTYLRPDQRKLPCMLSDLNFTVMFSRLGPEIMLRLFAHLVFERRILFVSSKLFHLTACACGCLYLIYPMHWQSIFLPVLPESLLWTSQCTAPYIIGIHSSLYSTMNKSELGDAVIVNIDERTIDSAYDDLALFPKDLVRSMKKGIQQSSQLIGDHLARVFLRTMAFILGKYPGGFITKNDKLDFDRDAFLQQYLQSPLWIFMSSVVNTQMFEQFSRYRTHLQLQRESDIDEFDIEVSNLERIQQAKKPRTNRRIYKLLEKTTNPLIEQIDDKTQSSQPTARRPGRRSTSEVSLSRSNLPTFHTMDLRPRKTSDAIDTHHLTTHDVSDAKSTTSSRSSTPELLLDLDSDDNLLLPSPIVLNVTNSSSAAASSAARPPTQIDSKIKQLQNELQYKVQTFDGKRIDPRHEYGDEQKEIRKLVQQFDPLDDETNTNRTPPSNLLNTVRMRDDEASTTDVSQRHPSILEAIPNNRVHHILQTIQKTYGTNARSAPAPRSSALPLSHFDPLAPTPVCSPPSDAHDPNLINLN